MERLRIIYRPMLDMVLLFQNVMYFLYSLHVYMVGIAQTFNASSISRIRCLFSYMIQKYPSHYNGGNGFSDTV